MQTTASSARNDEDQQMPHIKLRDSAQAGEPCGTQDRFDWRSRLKVHPAAELFPLMNKDELRQLADDIEEHGLRERVVVWFEKKTEAFVLLDGRNRLDALELIGDELDYAFADTKPRQNKHGWYRFGNYWGTEEYFQVFHGNPYDFVVSKNIRRRHLTSDQKRDLIAELLKLDPEKSDRHIGTIAGADHKTVAKERRKQEGVGEIPHVAKRADTKGRKQPAIRKLPPKPEPKQNLLGTRVVVTEASEAKAGEKAAKRSAHYLAEFTVACRMYLPRITQESDRQKARALVSELTGVQPEAEAAP
jgi:hypothetical protein